MKKLTIEEKEKAYDEAIKKLRDFYRDYDTVSRLIDVKEELANLLPEIKESEESEDERIRKAISDILLIDNDEIREILDANNVLMQDIDAWLERKGEQDNNNEDFNVLQRFSFYSYKDEPNILYLSGIYVNEDYRNKGIGTKILKVADEVAASMKCNSIRLKTEKNSHAEKLYRENGYTTILGEEENQIWLEKQETSYTKKDVDDAYLKGDIKDRAKWMNYLGIKVSFVENQGEQSKEATHTHEVVTGNGNIKALVTEKVQLPNFKIGDTIVEKDFDECGYGTIKDIKDGQYIFTDGTGMNIDEQGGWQLVKTSTNIEQKPADKVEPKFHRGDWLVSIENGNVVKILEVLEDNYRLDFGRDTIGTLCIELVDSDYRLWDIRKDAKDGDILCTYECYEPKIVFILKGTPKKHYALGYHCYYNIMYPHFESDSEKGCLAPKDEDIKPATKEQSDTLLKAMADAGYTFDFEKKELKKIESYNLRNIIKDEPSPAIKKVVDSLTAWSEEDEAGLADAMWAIKQAKTIAEDENDMGNLLYAERWLKSLKDRCAWKPSEAQLRELKNVFSLDTDSWDEDILCELYKQLKQL